ncbi:hypothetical protein SLS53_001535 [Cytospora paraplurivora]|uniref:BTB domain-containing protein n=1 Tax=Cytospora paraplurivora TaxID=2898453 RepID=A0AAN9UI64_9PEZI
MDNREDLDKRLDQEAKRITSGDIPMQFKSLLERFGVQNNDNSAWTEEDAMAYVLNKGYGTDCYVEVFDRVVIKAHKAVLVAESNYFREHFMRRHSIDFCFLFSGFFNSPESGPCTIDWVIKYLYHPGIAGAPENMVGFLPRNAREVLPHCVEVLRLADVFQVAKMKDYAMERARDYIDSALHDRFCVAGSPKVKQGLYYLGGDKKIELREFGVLYAIKLLINYGPVESEHGKQILQDIVLLVIGIKHRVQDAKEDARDGALTPEQRFLEDLQELCKYEKFLKLYLKLDVKCSAYRKDSVLYAKTNEVIEKCQCPSHPETRPNNGGPFEKIKRSDIKKDGNYVLLNPFDGGRSIYCWDCAGRRGYPWRPFRRISER